MKSHIYSRIVVHLLFLTGLLAIMLADAAPIPSAGASHTSLPQAEPYRIFLPFTVKPDPQATRPTISVFSAAPANIQAGQVATLNWTVSRATSLRIEPGVGDVSGKTSIDVQPNTTTIYTLIAVNAAGETRATTTVTVGGTQPGARSFFLPGEAPTRNFEVEYDAQGRMHSVFVRHTADANVQEVIYATCAPGATCDTYTAWQTTVVHRGAIGGAQIETTADGRLRIVVQDEYTIVSVRLVYFECNADCSTATNWSGIALGRELPFGEAFLQHVNQRWFAINPQGAPRILVSNANGAFFLTCDADCTADGGMSWKMATLDTTGDEFQTNQLYDPVLQITPDGRPHILGKISNQTLVYLTCAADCGNAQNWGRVNLSNSQQQGVQDQLPVALLPANHDLEIDTQGHVVVAFWGTIPGDANTNRMYLWRCAASCLELANWAGRPFPNTFAGGLELSISPQNRPYIVFVGRSATTDERVSQIATCAEANCYDFNAVWTARIGSTSTEMEAEYPMKQAPQTPPACNTVTTSWEHGSSQLIFDPAGRMRLMENAVATSICINSLDEWIDQWGTLKRGRGVDLWVLNARARWTIVP